MFRILGQILMLLVLLQIFGDAFAAFEAALIATFEVVESNAQHMR